MNNIFGFEISTNKFSSRIIDIKIKDEIIEKLRTGISNYMKK